MERVNKSQSESLCVMWHWTNKIINWIIYRRVLQSNVMQSIDFACVCVRAFLDWTLKRKLAQDNKTLNEFGIFCNPLLHSCSCLPHCQHRSWIFGREKNQYKDPSSKTHHCRNIILLCLAFEGILLSSSSSSSWPSSLLLLLLFWNVNVKFNQPCHQHPKSNKSHLAPCNKVSATFFFLVNLCGFFLEHQTLVGGSSSNSGCYSSHSIIILKALLVSKNDALSLAFRVGNHFHSLIYISQSYTRHYD